jgi:UDPglucose 6-dehydrogenase
MKIVTIGAGYVGLVSGVCLSQIGHDVVCLDKSTDRIDSLKSGKSPIYEPGLEEMMRANVTSGRLSFSLDLAASVQDANAVFICVGTPEDPVTGEANLTYVMAAASELAEHLDTDAVVVTKSTVPVGTNRKIKAVMEAAAPGKVFKVASNPEFLREGSAIGDFMEPDRIVVGIDDLDATAVMEQIYAPLTAEGYTLVTTDLESAETIKYAANAFLATKVTFINEIARLCERTGADVEDVAHGMGLDTRIGSRFLRAGPGYGGSCFPKDTAALASMGRGLDVPMMVTEAVMASNVMRKNEMVEMIVRTCRDDLAGKKVAVFGVTFKPDTDDMRDAPSLNILPKLKEMGADIHIVDPEGQKEGAALFPWAQWHNAPEEAASGADVIVVLTEWQIFRDVDLSQVSQTMRSPKLVDLRNVYDAKSAKSAGFEAYTSLGRPGF